MSRGLLSEFMCHEWSDFHRKNIRLSGLLEFDVADQNQHLGGGGRGGARGYQSLFRYLDPCTVMVKLR